MHIRDMLVGYARVSTDDQDLRLQRAALKDAGCRRTYEEKVSGAKPNRPELARMMDQLRSEEHTSELQSLMRISYAVFCLQKKKKHTQKKRTTKEEQETKR